MFGNRNGLMIVGIAGLIIMALIAPGSILAHQDVEDGQDHPLISRFAGSYIYSYEYHDFDQYVVPLGPLVTKRIEDAESASDLAVVTSRRDATFPQKAEVVEGAVTKLTYKIAEERSLLEVYRSYEQALTSGGFEILFSGHGPRQLGNYSAWHINRYGVGPEHRGFSLREEEDSRYLAARLSDVEEDVYVAIYMVIKKASQEVVVQLDIVEESHMHEGLVTVDADYERQEIEIPPTTEGDYGDSADHPLVSRFAGSYIYSYEYAAFDAYVIPLGPLVVESIDEGHSVPKLGAAASSTEVILPTEGELVEGEVTKITYTVPRKRSLLEVYRSYEQALQAGGFTILYRAYGEREIGNYALWHISRYGEGPEHRGHQLREPEFERYLAAKISHPSGDIYIALHMGFHQSSQSVSVQLDIVEPAQMEAGLVTVDTMFERIDATGAVAVYGIQFAFDSAEVLPESKGVLEQISQLLDKNDELELYVVGHTDDVGLLEYNMDLSKRRANAVVEVLVGEYGVAENRLAPIGVGPAAPVGSNLTEEGRQENRRVELVRRTD